jgi:hypothetical protein
MVMGSITRHEFRYVQIFYFFLLFHVNLFVILVDTQPTRRSEIKRENRPKNEDDRRRSDKESQREREPVCFGWEMEMEELK